MKSPRAYIHGKRFSSADQALTVAIIGFFVLCFFPYIQQLEFVWSIDSIFKTEANRPEIISLLLGIQVALLSGIALGSFYIFQISKNRCYYYFFLCWLAHSIYKIFGFLKIGADDSAVPIIAMAADLPLLLSGFEAKKRTPMKCLLVMPGFLAVVAIFQSGWIEPSLSRRVIFIIGGLQPLIILIWLAFKNYAVNVFGIRSNLKLWFSAVFVAIAIVQLPHMYFTSLRNVGPDVQTQVSWMMFSVLIFITILVIFFITARDQLGGIKKEKDQALEKLIVKGEFENLGYLASSIEHEIRNPLSSLKRVIEELKEKFRNENDELPDQFANLEKQSDRISTAADVINVLRKEKDEFSDELQPEKVIDRINTAIKHVKKEIPQISDEMFIEVHERTKNLHILAYADYIEMAFINLLKNSFEASRRAKRQTIKVFIELSLDESSNRVKVEFRDTGPGFIPADLSKLTSAQYTKKEKSTTKANRGIGLFVCEKVVNLHDGEIEFSNHGESGAVVLMRFPRYFSKKEMKIHNSD